MDTMGTSIMRGRYDLSILAVTTLALVGIGDFLFYEQTIGWTLGAYVALLTGVITWRGWPLLRHTAGAVLTLGMLGLCAAMVEHPGVVPVVLGLAGLITLAMTARGGWTVRLRAWIVRWVWFLMTAWLRPFADSRIISRWKRQHRPRSAITKLKLTGWVVPILLTAGFVALLGIANPVIARWLADAWAWWRDLWSNLFEYIHPVRVLLWLFLAISVWGLLRVRVKRAGKAAPITADHVTDQALPPAPPGSLGRIFDPTMVVRCLLLFNAVFLTQTVLDLLYLWKVWGDFQLPEGLTYAGYAHRGAYALIFTALLAGVFVLITFRPRGAAQRSAWARWLVYLWLALNVWLIISTLRRLEVYVDVYALSRWRVAAAIWMGAVALALVWVILRIVLRRPNAWLVRMNVLTAMVIVYVCSFVNFDGMIAQFNVRHCRELGTGQVPLDVDYLQRLGFESLPALEWFAAETSQTNPKASWQAVRTASALRVQLDTDMTNWRGWTWRQQRLRDARMPLGREVVDVATPAQ